MNFAPPYRLIIFWHSRDPQAEGTLLASGGFSRERSFVTKSSNYMHHHLLAMIPSGTGYLLRAAQVKSVTWTLGSAY